MIEFAPFFEKEMLYSVTIHGKIQDDDISGLLEGCTGRIFFDPHVVTEQIRSDNVVMVMNMPPKRILYFTDENAAIMFRLAMN